MIKNHGFNTTVMELAWEASRTFFDLPMTEKVRYKTQDESEYPYGYEQSETLVKGKQLDEVDGQEKNSRLEVLQDLKETFAIGPSNPASGMPLRRWVEETNQLSSSDSNGVRSSFQTAVETYYEHMERLAATLLKIFAIALEEPPTYFHDKMDHHMSALRLVHYYPLQKPKHTVHVIRAGAHSDYGALTILAAKDKGLEVLLRPSDNEEAQWFPVPVIEGTLIINLGDLMQRWTNDKWISTLHRVAMPSTNAMERRYSMAYFVNVNGDTLIEPLTSCRDDGDDDSANGDNAKNHKITAGEHLMAKHLASMSAAGETSSSSHDEL